MIFWQGIDGLTTKLKSEILKSMTGESLHFYSLPSKILRPALGEKTPCPAHKNDERPARKWR